MSARTYWEFFPTELTLEITPGVRGTVAKAEMHIRTITGADLNILLHRPRLTLSIHSDLNDLSGNLAGVAQIKCFREPLEDGMVRCRVEIWREDNNIEIVGCKDIEGLPE